MKEDELYEYQEEQEIEVDILGLLFRLRRFWALILVATVMGASCAGIYTKKCVKPLYEASAMVYMRGNGTESTPSAAFQELQVNTELTNDYEVIFKSRPIMQKVVNVLSLKMTYKQLASKVQITNLSDTRILKVTVQDKDPLLAKNIVNEIVNYGVKTVNEIDAKEPYVIEDAIEDHDIISPNLKMNTLIGGLIGFVLTVGIIALQYILNDRIVTADDVEKYLQLSVLCEIVDDDSFNCYEKGGKSNGKFKNRKQWFRK